MTQPQERLGVPSGTLIEWVDEPPPSQVGKNNNDITAITMVRLALGQVMTRYNEWALLKVDVGSLSSRATMAHRIRNGEIAPGHWKATQRGEDIYVKFLGFEEMGS